MSMLTESWMEQLMERTVAKGQTVDDLLRRSAGIPAAFIALFLSEPEEKPLMDPVEQKDSNSKHMDEEVDPSNMHPSEKLSKVRDEGVVPTVHAFNVLKAAFNDTNLGTDTSGFSAEAMTVAIRSFSSPYWEVRNSATLAIPPCYRMVGFLNVQKRGSARRGLTGLEFFTGLVSNEKLQSVLLRIASTLPSNEVQCGSFNYLHGVLLQLGNLLDTNCRDLADDSKKDQIIEQLVNVLAKCTWMVSPLLCPCPIISTSFLRVLDHMRAIGWKNLRDVYKLHLDLSTRCLDADASYGFSYYDPTVAELREQAAVSYFGCVFQPSDEAAEVFQITQKPNSPLQKVPEALDFPDLKDRLLRCLSDQSYEVRLATLKWFLQFLKAEDSSFSETSSIWHWASNGLQKSSSSEQVNVRQASAEAIIASGILEQANLIGPLVSNHQTPSRSKFQNACDVYAYQILEMWFTCIKLLEDEDDLIRSKLATDVQKCFFSTAMEVPTQVEKVLELSFDHLSSVFGHWNEYFLYLSRWVFSTADYTAPLKGGSDLVRRVFDKEIDNHHEEKLLILQFCCDHLQKLANRDLPQGQLLEWRSKFHNKLLCFAKDHVGKQRESWVGGVGNHKDVFLPLYGNLLGLYVFSNCILRFSTDGNDKKAMFADMVELGEALKPFLRNPLVSNMFRVVVGLHEKSVDDSLVDLSSVLAGEVWEGFDPYFLLR
ncbi:hypothetical protein Bca52824_071119 [Brassica carinata]|uniref:DUF2428 domain-containing protein n=1 Tax=Brassica carinata TaxID=52824 RepID=A0A8X7Q8F3_BRACI|nr:hypothetical protein Bca52824_071119 [Brassica carinata]